MVHLFRDMDIGAGLFIRQDYAAAIPVFIRILEADSHNFMAALRLAVAYSVTGNKDKAQNYFDRARAIDPTSIDLRQYQAMHYLKYQQWDLAAPLFESVLAESPDRIPALTGLATVYKHQGELKKSMLILQRIVKIKESPGLEWARIGQLRMTLHDTKGAMKPRQVSIASPASIRPMLWHSTNEPRQVCFWMRLTAKTEYVRPGGKRIRPHGR